MPFASVSDLPERIKNRFKAAPERRAFLAAFNSAFAGTCKDGGRQGDREGCSFAIASTAAQNVTKGDSVDTAVSKALHVHDEDEKKRRRKKKKDEDESKLTKFFKSLVGLLSEGEPESNGQPTDTVSIVKAGAIVKTNDELQVFYAPVFVPDEEHGQGLVTTGDPSEPDVVSKDEIRKAAHGFMADLALSNEVRIGLNHDGISLSHDQAQFVECWLEKADVIYETPRGSELMPEGAWMVGIHVDADIWKSIRSGEPGMSMEGTGVRTLV